MCAAQSPTFRGWLSATVRLFTFGGGGGGGGRIVVVVVVLCAIATANTAVIGLAQPLCTPSYSLALAVVVVGAEDATAPAAHGPENYDPHRRSQAGR